MKFSYNWLRDLVDPLDTPPRELAQLITIKTAESEGVEPHENDHVIEIDNKSLTHRPDLWGHYGMAREVAAILGRKPVDGRSDKLYRNLNSMLRTSGRFDGGGGSPGAPAPGGASGGNGGRSVA